MNERRKKLKERAREAILSDPLFGGDIVRLHIRVKNSKEDETYFPLIDDLLTRDVGWKKVIIKAIEDFYLPSEGDLDLLKAFAREEDWELSQLATKVIASFCHKSELAQRTVREMAMDDFQMENFQGSSALRFAGLKAPNFVLETVQESLSYFQGCKKDTKRQYMRRALFALGLIKEESAVETALSVVFSYLDDSQLGIAAAEALGGLTLSLSNDKTLNHLRSMAKNSTDALERTKAAAALFHIAIRQPERVREDLERLLKRETSERVIYYALRALWYYTRNNADWVLSQLQSKMPLLRGEGTIGLAFSILKEAAFRAPQKVYELSRKFSRLEAARIRGLHPLILWSCADDMSKCVYQLKELAEEETAEEGLVASLAMVDLGRPDRMGNLSIALQIHILGEGESVLLHYPGFFRKHLNMVLASEYRNRIVEHLFAALSSSNSYPIVPRLCECIGRIASRDEAVFSRVLSVEHPHQKFMMLRHCVATYPDQCSEEVRNYAQQSTKTLHVSDSNVDLMVALTKHNPEWPVLNLEAIRGNCILGEAEVFARVYGASFDAQPEDTLEKLDQWVDSEFDPNFFYFWKRLSKHRLPVAFSAVYGRAFDPKPIGQEEAIDLLTHFRWAVKQVAASPIKDEVLLVWEAIDSLLTGQNIDGSSLRAAKFSESRLGQMRAAVATAIANALEKLETDSPSEPSQASVVEIQTQLVHDSVSFLESHNTQIKEGSISFGLGGGSWFTRMYLPEVRLAVIALNMILGLKEDTCSVVVEK